jgi:hypothetical protein
MNMKNLFIKAALAAFFIAGNLSAQSSMEIHDVFGNIVDGDTMYYYVAVNGTHYTDFHQYNLRDTAITYKVKKTQVTMTATSSAWFCVYANSDANNPQSQCYIPSTVNSGDFVTDSAAHNMLLADFAAGANTGISIVQYKFYDKYNPADSSVITLVYNVTPVGISENAQNEIVSVYPNPAEDKTVISLTNTSESASIVITDLYGRTVFSQSMNPAVNSVAISTKEWSSGIYFVNVIREGKITSTQKLMVR